MALLTATIMTEVASTSSGLPLQLGLEHSDLGMLHYCRLASCSYAFIQVLDKFSFWNDLCLQNDIQVRSGADTDDALG